MIDIEIMPIKKLYDISRNNYLENSCAIITSSYSIHEEKLNNIKKLALQFDDIKEQNSHSFNQNMANQIHQFINENLNYKKLYIACDSGESRSSAIAAATYKYLGKNDKCIWKNYHYQPNEFVYKLMCKEYRNTCFKFSIKTQKIHKQKKFKQTNKEISIKSRFLFLLFIYNFSVSNVV